MKIFKDRRSAGKLLAKRLQGDWGNLGDEGMVLSIPRGGIVVAAEVARELNLPLDVLVTRKIGAPFQPELALGAVDPDGEVVWEKALLGETGIRSEQLGEQVKEQWKEVKRREDEYRAGRKPLEVGGKTVILIDDGIATGATTLSAINYLKRHNAKKIILAVPVASKEAERRVIGEIGEKGEVIVLETPEYFQAVGQFYKHFEPVEDAEVVQWLNEE